MAVRHSSYHRRYNSAITDCSRAANILARDSPVAPTSTLITDSTAPSYPERPYFADYVRCYDKPNHYWHKIKPGDTCWDIAQANNVPLDNVLKSDPKINADCTNLQVGDHLCFLIPPTNNGTVSTPPIMEASSVARPDAPGPIAPAPAPSDASSAVGGCPAPYGTPVSAPAAAPSTGLIATSGAAPAIPTASSLPGAPPSGACTGVSHTVVTGDTCYTITEAYSAPLDDAFYAANPAINKECTNLEVGQVICVPGGGAASTPGAATSAGPAAPPTETTAAAAPPAETSAAGPSPSGTFVGSAKPGEVLAAIEALSARAETETLAAASSLSVNGLSLFQHKRMASHEAADPTLVTVLRATPTTFANVAREDNVLRRGIGEEVGGLGWPFVLGVCGPVLLLFMLFMARFKSHGRVRMA